MLTARLNHMLPDLLDTFKRFPVAVIAALGLFVYVNVLVVGHDTNSHFNVMLAFAAVFFAAGAGHLIGEGRGSGSLIYALALGLAAGALIYFNLFFHASELFLFGGLLPLLMIAPYLHRGVQQGAVWLFNVRLGLAAILAFVVGIVFGLGLSAVLAGLHYLFNIEIADEYYQRIWALAVTVIGPLYGLSIIPRDLSEEVDLTPHKGSLMERGVSVLVNYVLVPLALIYAVILHAYAVKILVQGELPKGQIGTIVSLFALGGTATWLIGWPWRETGTKLLQLFMRGWFWLLPVPAVLLSMAIWQRVSDYGVTPDRYGIALVAVWTALVFLYLVLRRNRADMRVILGAAAVLLLIGSFGPQGAYGTTGVSQFARLKAFLEAKGILKDGAVQLQTQRLVDADRITGDSILTTLREVNQLDILKPWFGASLKSVESESPDSWNLLSAMQQKLGVDAAYVSQNNVNFSAQLPVDHSWAGKSRMIGPMRLFSSQPKTTVGADVEISFDAKFFQTKIDGQVSTIAIPKLMDELKAGLSVDFAKTPHRIVDLDSHVSLVVKDGSGEKGEHAVLNYLDFWVVVHE
jgi:hypothetical protein